jgi:hypothetical protein
VKASFYKGIVQQSPMLAFFQSYARKLCFSESFVRILGQQESKLFSSKERCMENNPSIPILFPYEPAEFWIQMRRTIQEEIINMQKASSDLSKLMKTLRLIKNRCIRSVMLAWRYCLKVFAFGAVLSLLF